VSDITGKMLRNRYQVERLLGRGGMADVYLAFDLQRQTNVAIKLIREDLADDADFIRRFSREAAALARLDHPNVVRFYSTEQDGALSFIVMDYVPGSTLQRRLAQAGGPLSLPETTTLLHQIGPALHYAHTMGFIHRDIKPGNIMLREDGTALLSDFGAARVAESATLATLTVGTPAYMSPEQILGRDLQPQSDIYSFGIVLYEMLAGRRPFTGEENGLTGTGTISRLREAHLRLDPPDLTQLNPAVPPALSSAVLKAMAKNVADRWPNVLSLVDAWDTALGGASQRRRAGAGVAAASASSIETVAMPMSVPAPPSAPAPAVGAASQPVPSGRAEPPAGGSPPPAAAAAPPRKGPSPIVWIVGAVAGLLILGLILWQFIMPSLAASRPTQPEVNTGATAAALESLARDATATAQSGAQLAAAAGAQQTSTTEAQSAARAASVAGTATAEFEATRQAKDASAAATARAEATRLKSLEAEATSMAYTMATQEAASNAASAEAAYVAATATAAATPTSQPTPTVKPTATSAPPAPTKAAAPATRSKPAGVVLDFESETTWRRGTQPYGELTRVTDPVHSGAYSSQLAYNFPAVKDNFVVFQARPAIAIAGQPTALYAWVYGDGSGHMLNAWLQDGSGQVRQYTFGPIKHQGWQQMSAPLDDNAGWPNVHIGGPDSGKLAFPVSLSALVLDGIPDGSASKGTIYIDDLTSTTQAASLAPAASTRASVTPAPAVAAALSGRIAVPIFAPDRQTYDLYVGNIDGSNFQRVRDRASQPSLRADGKQIAFRDWNSSNRSVVVMDTYGGNARRVTNFAEDGLPAFSPDGQQLVFHSAREPDRQERIYEATISDRTDRALDPGGAPVFGLAPIWTNNGHLVYKSTYPRGGITAANPDGSGGVLLHDDTSDTSPTSSPDGLNVAFMSRRDGNWNIYRVKLDGSGLTRLTDNGANDGLPAWSPDGKSIAFVSNRDGGWAVWVMNADGSNQRRLFSLPGSPDGQIPGEADYNTTGWTTERMSWSQ
jgi:eukaryotic-like serine/threonine-protein kinase